MSTTTPNPNVPVRQAKPVSPLVTFRSLLEQNKGAIALALPKHLTVDRMMRLALTTVQTNPDILDCDHKSILASIVVASQLGLEIGIGGQAYLVPFNVSIKNKATGQFKKIKQCQLIPGYRGLVNIARRSGDVDTFESHVVYKNDHFEYEYGTNAHLTHKPVLDRDRGPIVAAYAYAQLKGSKPQFEVMSIVDLERIRASAQSSDSPAYKNWEDEMYRKAPAKRLCKWLPFSVEMARAADLDDRAGLPQDIGEVIDVETEPEGEPSKLSLSAATDALKARAANESEPAGAEDPGLETSPNKGQPPPSTLPLAIVQATEPAGPKTREAPIPSNRTAPIDDIPPLVSCTHGFPAATCAKCAEERAEDEAERAAIQQERPSTKAEPAKPLEQDETFLRLQAKAGKSKK